MEDENRLQYIATNQSKLRADYIQGIYDAVEKGIYETNQIGKKYCYHLAMLGPDVI